VVSLHRAEIAGWLWGSAPGSEALQGAAGLSPRPADERGLLPDATLLLGLEHLKRPSGQRQAVALGCARRSAGLALEPAG